MPRGQGFGVIWDMDGTLVDTADLHFDAWQQVCREKGRSFDRADFAATFGRRNPEILHWLFGDRIAAAEREAFADHKEEVYRVAARRAGVAPLPGVRSLLQDLHQLGVTQGIGSSAPRANLDLILEVTGVGCYIATVASSEDTQRGKPDPQVFLVAASRLGVAPAKCLVVEDAVAGVEAAKAASMKCIGVTFVGHHSADKLKAAGADLVVRTLEEVSTEKVLELLGA